MPVPHEQLLYSLFLFGLAHEIKFENGQFIFSRTINSVQYQILKFKYTFDIFQNDYQYMLKKHQLDSFQVYKSLKPAIDFLFDNSKLEI